VFAPRRYRHQHGGGLAAAGEEDGAGSEPEDMDELCDVNCSNGAAEDSSFSRATCGAEASGAWTYLPQRPWHVALLAAMVAVTVFARSISHERDGCIAGTELCEVLLGTSVCPANTNKRSACPAAGSQGNDSWTEAVAGEGRDAAPFNVLLTCYTVFERDSAEQKLDRQFLRKWRWSHMVLVRSIAGALLLLINGINLATY